ncbi:hypothetical protein OCK74_05345 [Chitinophagaceae bacterium LB-8]|uniref:Outer membrane protein beta-barrel domain-containing protein n=1 Tax=Paraflavisolibacter caeni TaxID=2982496 RepID=A0A9X3BFC0_9BACT|nr:hypothetical protein [Paraflavisolibacter caeni]MCU7548529.1 hypothetical protein [Paraflavisolibacter caeni]
MQRKIKHDDFERFLQQNADQVRMYPSSAVWKNISRDVNKRRRRLIAFVASLILTISAGGYFVWNEFNTTTAENHEVSSPSKMIPSVLPHHRIASTTPTYLKKYKQQTSIQSFKSNKGSKEIPLLTVQPIFSDRTIEERQSLLTFMQEDLVPFNRMTGAMNELIALQSSKGLTNNFPLNEYSKNIKDIPVQLDSAKAEEAIAKINTREEKLQWQIFFSPNISYRKLSENKSFVQASTPPSLAFNYLGLYDVNNAVTHKPNIGFELGVMSKYTISPIAKLRAGFQFNVSRYDIKAFNYTPEVATIALNNGYRVDLINTISNYRNFNGGKTNWLKNYYFQASVPLGVEVKLTGTNKMHVGVASSLQPTYIIGDRAYLITNDYKNYAELPWLIRRWNINTNLETFVSYSSGKTSWQVGPQVRYQLLSSFVSKYPVKENLFDFGLKVGVTLNNH